MHRQVATPFALLVLFCGIGRAQKDAPTQKSSDLLPRVSLGIAVEETSAGSVSGLRVREIASNGPAAKAGLKKGDIIVRVSNRAVDNYESLIHSLAGYRPGEQVTFTVLRDRQPERVKVTLGEPDKGGTRSKLPEGARSCAFLGVLTVPVQGLTEETLDRLGLGEEDGAMVMGVVPGSPAALTGLRHGDVIKSINGKPVNGPEALREQLHQLQPGKEVTLEVQRGETARKLKATLQEGPCDISLFSRPGRGTDAGSDLPRVFDRLERRLDRIEQRLQELEGRREKRMP